MTVKEKKRMLKTWTQGHPWTMWYIAFVVTLSLVLEFVR